eukprot:gnl/TRDRNA2_/TRDRNA2_162370_c0_seq1.p2 gnl/TRDRNA2_/TRDRNA2_162370_c0~~gnl/TRDRNA2_/TRDRNA2_162370_c0_seq1.p2  ORF type:complete len:132 (+),score=7.54 gnl/TRDRNA2_/TRDRNA2_162370_c0_seq1:47-397(+)
MDSAGFGREMFSDRQLKNARRKRPVSCRDCAQKAVRLLKQNTRVFEGRTAVMRAATSRALASLPQGVCGRVEEFLQPPSPIEEGSGGFICPPCGKRFLRIADALQHCQARHSGENT